MEVEGEEPSFFEVVMPCWLTTSFQHHLFHLANSCFLVAYIMPPKGYGKLITHIILIMGFLLYSTWAWNIICVIEVFAWGLTFVVVNMGQALHTAYRMRPVKLHRDMEIVYDTLFKPLRVPRSLFKTLVSAEYAQVLPLHVGEAYAVMDLTKADRLALLIEGRVDVISGQQFLHTTTPMQFLDSPEFSSTRVGLESKFKVSVIGATESKYLFWVRSSLEYLFIREPYLATVMNTLVARDITTKLYTMNNRYFFFSDHHGERYIPGHQTAHSDVISADRFSSKIAVNKKLM